MRFERACNHIHPNFVLLIIGLLLTACTPKNAYIKMNPPPDVDKEEPRIPADETCWLATASNMLAAAGYGVGNIKFGYSYTHLAADMLWAFEDWLTVSSKEIPLGEEEFSNPEALPGPHGIGGALLF